MTSLLTISPSLSRVQVLVDPDFRWCLGPLKLTWEGEHLKAILGTGELSLQDATWHWRKVIRKLRHGKRYREWSFFLPLEPP